MTQMNYNDLKRLDSYSMLIVSKYFENQEDYINIISVCKKFKETTLKLHYNPIPITSKRLFPKIQTQYLYSKKDIKLKNINNYEIWYIVDYDAYLKFKEQHSIKCHHVVYTKLNKQLHGCRILNGVNMLGYACFSELYDDIGQSIVIPNFITYINDSCFCNCDHLQKIKLSKGLNRISNNCFAYCTSLTFIDIPLSIQSIGSQCFNECSSLKSIDIPNSVTSIGYKCFNECSSLHSVTLPTNITILQQSTFKNCSSLKNIEIPSSLIIIDNYCFDDCLNLQTILLPTSLTHIGYQSFPNTFNSEIYKGNTKLSSIHDYFNTKYKSETQNNDKNCMYSCSIC
ncbi:F-box domain-containing protein [Entamoeba marina]